MRAFKTTLVISTLAVSLTALTSAQQPPKAEPQMQAVLDQLAALGGKPIETLTPAEARLQPTPADAVKALLKKQGKDAAPEPVQKVEDRSITGPGGAIPIRIYTPNGAGPFPVVLYIHGGGWVIANLDTYDSSARALTNAAQAIVVSTHYRQAPEHKFPAAHEDAFAAYRWTLANAKAIGGDASKVAVAGESAGGNLAATIAIRARDEKLQQPVHQLLVYPVAGADMNTPSYQENAMAKPLNKPMMEWFAKHYLRSPADGNDPRISLIKVRNLKGLAPATIINAQIDPLRSEGEMYAQRLRDAGVMVRQRTFAGVTHEFFGMGAVVDLAKAAVQYGAEGLKAGFSGGAGSR